MINNNSKEDLKKNMDIIRDRLLRRKEDRLIAEVEFSYKIQGKEGIYHGLSFNISSYGMAFLRDTILSEGERLLFNFKLNLENVVIPGTVIRVLAKEVSVEFDLSDDEMMRFVKLFNQEIQRDKSSIYVSLKDLRKTL
jgi:hypothetical protein